MGFTESYKTLLPTIKAIPESEIADPVFPIAINVQEAANLKSWAETDKDQLIAAKLDWQLVESLTDRSAALAEAESIWQSQRFQKVEAQKKWVELSPAAYDLHDVLIHSFLYAYRKMSDLYSRVQNIAQGTGNEDMILDLNTLAVLGRENPDALLAIGFDLKELDRAAQLAAEMQSLLAEASGTEAFSEAKVIRDKAYTYLKLAVDEIRACGQYLFYRNKNRYIGYSSQYSREHRQTKKASETSQTKTQQNEIVSA